MPRRTLSFRLVASSIIWVAGSLLAAGLLLVLLFRNHIERRFDARLRDHIDGLVAASDVAPDGRFELAWTPSDPRYDRPLSGWYWQVLGRDGVVARSDSLWRGRLGAFPARPGEVVLELEGPDARPLRVLVEGIGLPGASDAFVFAVAGPRSDVERDVAVFGLQLAITLGALGLGLVSAVLFQIRFGLRPLRAMEGALADIRAGRIERLPESFPAEVESVVRELNSLLAQRAGLLERYRTQTANLAHALKNPLTVISNEVRGIGGDRGVLLREQTATVSKLIDRHLSRARVAGGSPLGARASVAAAVENIRFSMGRLHRDRDLELRVEAAAGLHFRGDAQDLEEMLGNLIDNACKWARGRVVVRADALDVGRLRFAIEDDGPGIPAGRCEEVLSMGRRLDSRMPGSGLGLGIVRDVAELYGGSLRLGRSRFGGLSAELELPAAE